MSQNEDKNEMGERILTNAVGHCTVTKKFLAIEEMVVGVPACALMC